MSWNSFGNFMSARSSALAEFGNMVANLVSAKNEKDISKRNEYYKQAGYSALLAFGNLASNIAPGSTSSHIVNGTNASVIASRLSGNISSAIQEHKDGKVNINRFQNILADLYSLGGLGSTLIEKNGNMQSWGIPLAIAGDIIAATAIATGDTRYLQRNFIILTTGKVLGMSYLKTGLVGYTTGCPTAGICGKNWTETVQANTTSTTPSP